MKKIIIILALFLLALVFTPKDTFAQGTFSCSKPTASAPCMPANVFCEDGYIPAPSYCSGRTTSDCGNAPTTACIKDAASINASKSTSSKGELFEGCEEGSINTAIGCIPINNTDEFISFILRWAIGIGGGIAFLLIVLAGFQIMTSSGNPDRLKAGQELMTSAIAGLILLIFSVFILKIIGIDILGLPGFGESL
jgi:hypothetical protein